MSKLIATLILILTFTTFSFADVCNTTYKDIVTLVDSLSWRVTSTNTGRHNTNSRHYKGKAVDVSVKFKSDLDVSVFIKAIEEAGYVVVDERVRPPMQRVWTGPHLHIYIPDCKNEEMEVKYEIVTG